MDALDTGLLYGHTPCRPGSLSETARAIAEVHADLLLTHPCRDGNGRLARWLADLMALQAGYSVPDYAFRGRGSRTSRARYLEAVSRGYVRNYADLTDFFREALERRLRRTG
jgi:cell filamentation protein